MNTNYIISVKDKTSGKDVLSPFVISSLENLNEFICEATVSGCVVIIDKINTLSTVPEKLFTILTNGACCGKED